MEAGAAHARPVEAPRGILRVWGDDRLVARVRGGDDRAFEAIYDRHHRGLLSFCRHMLGSREEAEDALQQTFASAYRALKRSDRPMQLKAWLYAIARNHCLSILRARREAAPLEDEAPALDGLAAEVERRGELRELVADLQRLPEAQRAALVLSELGAHNHDEIAVILGVRRDKVKALVFQARESLVTSRRAREMSCHEIREQLSVLRGGALRRASLRRHLDGCVGCQAFRADVQRQRAAMAVVLPVAPSIALKTAVLGPVLGTGAATVAATGVAGGLTGAASTVGGGLSLAGKGLATKALVAAAVAGSVGGGAAAVQEIRPAPPAAERPAVQAAPRAPGTASPTNHGAPAAAGPQAVGRPAGTARPHADGAAPSRRVRAHEDRAAADGPVSPPAIAGPTQAAPPLVPAAPSTAARQHPPASHRSPAAAPRVERPQRPARHDRRAGNGTGRHGTGTPRGSKAHPRRGTPEATTGPARSPAAPGGKQRDRAPKVRGGGKESLKQGGAPANGRGVSRSRPGAPRPGGAAPRKPRNGPASPGRQAPGSTAAPHAAPGPPATGRKGAQAKGGGRVPAGATPQPPAAGRPTQPAVAPAAR